MRRFTIAGGRLLTPMRELNGWMLVVRDGVITYAGRYDPDQVVRPILDACGQYIAPGFIDIHIHGGGGHDFMDGTAEAFAGASRAHAAHGTTTLLPTSLVCSDEELLGMFDVVRRVRETEKEKRNRCSTDYSPSVEQRFLFCCRSGRPSHVLHRLCENMTPFGIRLSGPPVLGK